MFFQTHKGSLQVFRYCSIFKVLCASAVRLTTCLFYHRSGFLSSPFFEAFELSELESFKSFSEQTGTFERSLVLFKGFVLSLKKSFFSLSAWRSHIVPHSRGFGKLFFKVFRLFSLFVYNSQFFVSNRPGFGYISRRFPIYI